MVVIAPVHKVLDRSPVILLTPYSETSNCRVIRTFLEKAAVGVVLEVSCGDDKQERDRMAPWGTPMLLGTVLETPFCRRTYCGVRER